MSYIRDSFIRIRTRIKRKIIKAQDNSVFYFSRWIFFGIIIGIGAGAGAIVLNELIRLSRFLFQVKLAHYYSPSADLMGATGAPPHAALVHWMIPVIVAAGGLIVGLLVYTLAPEVEQGEGSDDATIDAFHNKDGFIRGRVAAVQKFEGVRKLGSGGVGGKGGPGG